MGTDATQLLRRLKDYERALTRHIGRVSQEWSTLERQLQHLRSVYEGTAARDFLAHWQQSAQAFRAYADGGRQLLHLLNQRIAALEEADRAVNLG